MEYERGAHMESLQQGMPLGQLAVEESMSGSPWNAEKSRLVEKFPDTANECIFLEVLQATMMLMRGQHNPCPRGAGTRPLKQRVGDSRVSEEILTATRYGLYHTRRHSD